MSIDYTAYLFYGVQLPDGFVDEIRPFDEWENWLANKFNVELFSEEYKKEVDALGIRFVYTSLLGESPIYYLILSRTFKSADYSSPTKFDMPMWDNGAMVTRIKNACEKLDFEYTEPHWFLVINVS